MTVNEAIAKVDDLIKNNPIDRELKVAWLSALDHYLFLDTVSSGESPESFTPYTDGKDVSLLVPPPFDMLYVDYLKMKVYAELSDISRYNNQMSVFNNALHTWRCHLLCTCRPPRGAKVAYI